MRESLLNLFGSSSDEGINKSPAFSGLIHITEEGLKQEGLSLHEIHKDAKKMAKAAASTFKLTGMPSATLPLDLCSPAEMLGAELNYFEGGELMFPQVKKFLFESTKDVAIVPKGDAKLTEKNEVFERGRLSLVCEAIGLVKEDIGKDVVISGMIPGPYTLLLYLCNPKNLFIEMKKEPQAVMDALFHLSSFLATIADEYKKAGADFITIHDMGGSPGFIGPAKYEQFVLPAEKLLIEKLSKPNVLAICGNVTTSLNLLNQTGADIISLDQTVDLVKARSVLKDKLLFGNIDPVETLWRGENVQVAEAVIRAKEAGVDAVWPGCDLVIQTSIENIRSLVK